MSEKKSIKGYKEYKFSSSDIFIFSNENNLLKGRELLSSFDLNINLLSKFVFNQFLGVENYFKLNDEDFLKVLSKSIKKINRNEFENFKSLSNSRVKKEISTKEFLSLSDSEKIEVVNKGYKIK